MNTTFSRSKVGLNIEKSKILKTDYVMRYPMNLVRKPRYQSADKIDGTHEHLGAYTLINTTFPSLIRAEIYEKNFEQLIVARSNYYLNKLVYKFCHQYGINKHLGVYTLMRVTFSKFKTEIKKEEENNFSRNQ